VIILVTNNFLFYKLVSKLITLVTNYFLFLKLISNWGFYCSIKRHQSYTRYLYNAKLCDLRASIFNLCILHMKLRLSQTWSTRKFSSLHIFINLSQLHLCICLSNLQTTDFTLCAFLNYFMINWSLKHLSCWNPFFLNY